MNNPDAANLFHAALRGWKDGTTGVAMKTSQFEHDANMLTAYNDGYERGHAATAAEANQLSERYGYKPSILRAMQS